MWAEPGRSRWLRTGKVDLNCRRAQGLAGLLTRLVESMLPPAELFWTRLHARPIFFCHRLLADCRAGRAGFPNDPGQADGG
jgi:hypothetical protein